LGEWDFWLIAGGYGEILILSEWLANQGCICRVTTSQYLVVICLGNFFNYM
jgi:hypothetical protein